VDFDRLITVLREYGLPVRIGFEATGNHHRAWRIIFAAPGSSSSSSRRSDWLGRGRLCTIAGTRTIRGTPRLSCTCFRSAPSSSFMIRWWPA
jgi:hypothetical protein